MNKESFRIVIGIIIILLGFAALVYYGESSLRKHGIYTIAKVTKWEAAEQGSSTYCNVYYNNRIYNIVLPGNYQTQTSEFYFIKILPNDPNANGGLLTKVPECILTKPLPPKGWSDLPRCDNGVK